MKYVNLHIQDGTEKSVESFLKNCINKILLQPNGISLLDPIASVWLFSFAILILIFSIIQSISIGKYLIAEFEIRLLFAYTIFFINFLGLSGVYIVFTIIFLSGESSFNDLKRRVINQKSDGSKNKDFDSSSFSLLKLVDSSKKGLGITALISLITLNPIIDLILKPTPKSLSTKNKKQVLGDDVITLIISSYDSEILKISNRIDSLYSRERSFKENKNLSDERLSNPAYLQISTEIYNSEKELNIILKNKEAFLSENIIISYINEAPTKQLRLTIKMIINLNILILIILLFLRHNTVNQYYSISLQTLYSSYKQGIFDFALDIYDRSNTKINLKATEFEKLLTKYESIFFSSTISSLLKQNINSIETEINLIRTRIKSCNKELNALKNDRKTVSLEIETLTSLASINFQFINSPLSELENPKNEFMLEKTQAELVNNLYLIKEELKKLGAIETKISKKKDELEFYESSAEELTNEILTQRQELYTHYRS